MCRRVGACSVELKVPYPEVMPVILRTNWWALVLRGVVAILLAVVTFAVPGVTIAFLLTVFGIYALIDGVLAIFSTIRAVQGHRRWGAFLIEGIVGVVFGLYAILAPVAAAAVFVNIVAFWAILTGVAELFAAIRLRRDMQGELMLFLIGIVSILFGVFLLARPVAGAVFFVYVLAGYGLIFGILLINFGLRMRNANVGGVRV